VLNSCYRRSDEQYPHQLSCSLLGVNHVCPKKVRHRKLDCPTQRPDGFIRPTEFPETLDSAQYHNKKHHHDNLRNPDGLYSVELVKKQSDKRNNHAAIRKVKKGAQSGYARLIEPHDVSSREQQNGEKECPIRAKECKTYAQ